MKLLLDTHTFLWLVDGNTSLSATAQAALAETANPCFLAWLRFGSYPSKPARPIPNSGSATRWTQYISKWTKVYQVQEFPSDLQHALHVAVLPQHHADPIDRLLIAQAAVETMTLVSADRKFTSYSIALLW